MYYWGLFFLNINFWIFFPRKTFLPQSPWQSPSVSGEELHFSEAWSHLVTQDMYRIDAQRAGRLPLIYSLCISAACHSYLDTKSGILYCPLLSSFKLNISLTNKNKTKKRNYKWLYIVVGKECLLFPCDSQALHDCCGLRIQVALCAGKILLVC